MKSEIESIPYSFIHDAIDLEHFADKGIRHRSGDKPEDYLKHWLQLFRPFAFASRDDSWGELEKVLSIIFRVHVFAHRRLQVLFPKTGISDITPEMVQLLVDLRKQHCVRCPDCDNDMPGHSFIGNRFQKCPTCKGANWVVKE
jgi:hypothetical protein